MNAENRLEKECWGVWEDAEKRWGFSVLQMTVPLLSKINGKALWLLGTQALDCSVTLKETEIQRAGEEWEAASLPSGNITKL